MSSNQSPYDPHVSREEAADTPAGRAQKAIDKTLLQLQDNVQKTSQRGERLDALQDKTDQLSQSAGDFRRGANRVRKQMWWKDMKMRMCIIAGIIILLIVIIVPSVVATRK